MIISYRWNLLASLSNVSLTAHRVVQLLVQLVVERVRCDVMRIRCRRMDMRRLVQEERRHCFRRSLIGWIVHCLLMDMKLLVEQPGLIVLIQIHCGCWSFLSHRHWLELQLELKQHFRFGLRWIVMNQNYHHPKWLDLMHLATKKKTISFLNNYFDSL